MGKHTTARHRAPGRAITPLTGAFDAVSSGLKAAGRRTAVVAGASGIVLSMALPGIAAPVTTTPNVDPRTLSQEAQALAATAPTVTVAAEAAFELSVPEISIKKDRVAPRVAPRVQRPTAAGAVTATSNPVAVAPQAASGSTVVGIAASLIGAPYAWGGTTPAGFDCSGFVSYVYAKLGISLPHSSSAIKKFGRVIPYSEARPGDIVWTPGHVSIFVGGTTVLDSLKPGTTVNYRTWYSTPTFIRIG